jgi:hypothetical protein
MKYAGIALLVGVLALAAYLVINSTSQKPSECAGDWTDYVNPLCLLSTYSTAATNELNTILIIVAAVVVAVIGLLAFGPQTQHIASGVSAFV